MTNTSIGATLKTSTSENAANSNLTLSANVKTTTDLTYLTNVTGVPTTNGEFLSAIFQGLADPLRPFVLSFAGKPKDRKAWGGEAWRADKSHTDNAALNWYFSLAAYYPNDDGYHRREKDCAAIYGLMLDDLGTKALPVNRLDACPPSYVIETSEGNFQAGYLFTAPVTAFESIKDLNQRMVEAGLCDPGAKSPTTRYGRMPFASNRKYDPAFQCKLTQWHPTRRYTVTQIIDGLGLAPPKAKTSAPPAASSSLGVTLATALPEGARDNTLTSMAGSMRRRGMTPEAIYAALTQENNLRCQPPLPDADVRRISESVSRYAPDAIASQPQYSRRDLSAMIEATSDFDELTGNIAKLVSTCDLKDTERLSLRKFIAKKAHVSVASLKDDAKLYSPVTATRDFDHLKAAREVIKAFGDGNLLDASGYLWRWRGDGAWRRVSEREIKQKIHDVTANNELTAAVVNSVLDMVKTEAHRPEHRFDEDPHTINCTNGELAYQNGRWALLPHNREHYRTAMLPVAYAPAAGAPRFEQFLREIFSGDTDATDKAAVVLEALGYTFIPSCYLEKFFMLIGAGANGKSVLLHVVAALVGREHVCAVQPNQFDNRFQRGHLQGRLANIITEIAEGAEIADAQLKSLVSGEMTTAEHKHKDPFDFLPYAKHWFGTNHLPHTRDFSDALFRRAVILTFNNKFEGAERDVHLLDKLKTELPGILNLALAGLQRLFDNNTFTECSSSTDAARLWRMEADQVAQFVADDCETGTHCRATSAVLFTQYLSWANSAGVRRTLNRNNFTNRLKRNGFEPGRGTGGTRIIAGVQPKLNSLPDTGYSSSNYAYRRG